MKNKKIFRVLCEILILTALILAFNHLAFAKAALPLEDATVGEYKQGLIPGPYSAENLKAIDIANELIFEDLLVYVKIIIAAVAVLFISIMGYRLVTAGGDEEQIKKAKTGLTYAIIGLVLLSMSQDIAKIFDMEKKTLIENPREILERIKIFDRQVEIIIVFIKYIIGTFAVLMIVRSSIKLITAGGNEEEVTKARQSIMYSSMGLVLIYIGGVFINKVFYKIDKSSYSGTQGLEIEINPGRGVEEIAGITTYMVYFLGPIAMLMLIIGALMYLTAGGEEEKMQKAKRLLFATGAGIVIIFGAFAIVSTILAGKLSTGS